MAILAMSEPQGHHLEGIPLLLSEMSRGNVVVEDSPPWIIPPLESARTCTGVAFEWLKHCPETIVPVATRPDWLKHNRNSIKSQEHGVLMRN
ncbi:hypothetical protein LIER_37586 [Lithospermum erythrorhizon]|uniref:Uncharacterized protein n=1 Tax=Lithospermum erythrorhizon TaxID=34254 RepID=A0AAV3PRF5_LITER